MSKNRQESEDKKRVRVSSKPQSSIPELPTRALPTPSRLSGGRPSVRGAQSRSKVELEPHPSRRRLPEIPEEVSSSPGSREATKSRSVSTVEFKVSTLAILLLGNVLLLCLAFIGGRSSVPEAPAGMGPGKDDDLWPLPVLNPEPEDVPAIQQVVDSDGNPIAIVAADPQNGDSSAEVSEDVTDLTAASSLKNKKRWVVMIGQKLSKDAEVIDDLLMYVDSGLTDSVTRIRVRQKRYDVYVGPFDTQADARSALSQLMVLRSKHGIRFADAYINELEFSPEELEALK
ncbi:MAG: hypothetical protein CBC13_03195 [Planctomycetia bacterium TMED53]|nr:MAG: hypothetical protein CBC13_03195 [Planctomycetia bacterium TMED53]